jgi:hypothetical protein
MSDSLSLAQELAWNLATTLMVCVTLFKAGNGLFSVCPSAEFDGDAEAIICIYDPFEP